MSLFHTILEPALFRALAEPTRLRILEVLMQQGGSSNVSTLAADMEVDMSVVSRHLGELVRAGVLSVERRGRERWYTMELESLITQFQAMTHQLENLRRGLPCC